MSAIAAIPGLVTTVIVVAVMAIVFGPLIYVAVFKEDGTAHARVVALINAWRRKNDDTPSKKGGA